MSKFKNWRKHNGRYKCEWNSYNRKAESTGDYGEAGAGITGAF